MPIDRDLHELLHAHDCVIVPRFGGFLTHYRPARIDEQRQLVHPPSKDLSFNRHLVRTDGLLADHVARREQVGFGQAHAIIDGEVDGWRGKIDRDGRLELARIGTFYKDAESNLQFEPDRRVNYLKDAFGLRPVPAVAIAPAVPERDVPVLPLRPRKKEDDEQEKQPMPILWAAAVVAILSTAVTWWMVSAKGPVNAQWSGFDLFTPSEPAIYAPRTGAVPAITDVPADAAFTIPDSLHGIRQFPLESGDGALVTVDLGPDPATAAPPDLSHSAKADTTAVVMPVMRSRYHIIGGCFLQKDNADGFVATLQARGFAAAILDQKGGLYRVAYGSYPQRALALEALAAVRKEEARQAWLLVE